MAMNLRTTTRVDSARDFKNIEADLRRIAGRIPVMHSEFRIVASKCMLAKRTIKYVDKLGSEKMAQHDPHLDAVIESLKKTNPNYSLHDIHVGMEGILDDYAKKVSTFAQTMFTTVKQYSVNLFDLFVKKLKLNSKIDTTKFIGIDSSMRMIVMTYGDYAELGHPIVEKSEAVVKDVQAWFASLGRVRKALKTDDDVGLPKFMAELTKKINEGPLASYLKDHLLVDFQFGQDQNGNGGEGLVKIVPSKRFENLEQSYILSEAGWVDVDKLKESLILQQSEAITKNINALYKCAMDLMDESRRISSDFCVKDPYTCAVLVKYASLVAQMVNCYTKAFDMCWTTCLRVSQACLVEG